MSLGMFVVLTTLGSAVWNTLLVLGGYLLGRQWRTVGRYSDWLNWAVVVLLVLGSQSSSGTAVTGSQPPAGYRHRARPGADATRSAHQHFSWDIEDRAPR